jgi:SAM-dependent methyltransferase
MFILDFHSFLSAQLGLPSGWFGQLLIRFLNRNNALMNDLVLQLLNLQIGDRVLEIGFGGGYLLDQISRTELPALTVGLERSSEAINLCQQKFCEQISQRKIELFWGDAAELPFPDVSFNQICTVNTIYFWTNASIVLAECFRVLAPNGKLVICYNSKDFLRKQKFSQHGFISYEVTEIEMMLQTAGFTQIVTVSGKSDQHQEFFCTLGERI